MLRDPDYLRKVAYSSASKLDARVAFWKKYGGEVRNQFGGGLVETFSPSARASILEVGCGTGEFWAILGSDIQPDWTITLSDLSRGMLGHAKTRLFPLLGNGLRFLVADLQHLPFADDTFDAAIANYMLYHLPDVNRGIDELARVLKADGTLYASTNSENHLREIRALQEEYSTAAQPDTNPGEHVSAFSLENGAEQLGRHFAAVTVNHQTDMIFVSSVDDLMGYMDSLATPMDLDALRERLTLEVDRDGGLSITRSSGHFIAKRPRSL